jgi:hypothetical protein
MKQTNINIDEIKRYPTVTNPIKADDLHTPQAYAYTLRRVIVTDCNDRQRAELVELLDGKDTTEGVTFNNTRVNRDRLHIWQNEQSRKERAAILGEGWEYVSGLHHGTQPGDLITCLDGTRGRVTKSDPESSCVIEFETEDGQRLSVAGFFRYTPSETSQTAHERKGIMKTYDIDVHFDASIRMHGIIADSEEQARDIARKTAKEMNLFAAAVEREDAGEKVAECRELTAEEIRREEREQVEELVPWLLEQQTPTEWHYYAHGGAFDWTCYQSEDTTDWERQLFASIANGTHKDTALFNRYARLLSRQRWQDHAATLYSDWDEAWQQARRDPEETRVIIETNEQDPSAPRNEFGRYFMVDGSMKEESYIEFAGQWVVTRVDVVTSPFEVHRPNWCSAQGYADSSKQICCRSSRPNNVTRWAKKMIDAGRVVSISAEGY